ncbi:MAG: thioredoxin family protein [Myxococcales bacterium]|nr:thioredoxin family protein [Myxococcales bacterium]
MAARIPRTLAIGLGLASLLALLGWLALRPAPAQAAGLRWADLTLEEALAEAEAGGGRILIEFEASWCPACRLLDAELLSTEAGAALGAGNVALRFDFDDPAMRPLIERFAVLSLPTLLVLTADGVQIGRLEGYSGREAFLEQARALLAATDPIPGLRLRHEARPEDPAAALALGEALLVRGSEDPAAKAEGEALLERVIFLQGPGANATAPRALFVLGRYHQRVRREPAEARHYWRELATRFPESEYALGAYAWYARAEAETGRPQVGYAVLLDFARAHPDDPDAISILGSYVISRDPEGADRAWIRERIDALLPSAEEEAREELQELRAGLLEPATATTR